MFISAAASGVNVMRRMLMLIGPVPPPAPWPACPADCEAFPGPGCSGGFSSPAANQLPTR